MDQKKVFLSSFVRQALCLGIAAAVSCLLAPLHMAAASPAKGADVTFTASGTFADTPKSGADTLLLRGQPFTISVVGNSSLTPSQHLKNWALFMPLNMSGTVYSGLLPNQPIAIRATTAAIYQAVGPDYDLFQAGFPIEVIGIALTARAYITLPAGTMKNPLLRPFSSVALTPDNATVTYSNTTNSTTLAVQTGTLVATAAPPGGAATRAALTPLSLLGELDSGFGSTLSYSRRPVTAPRVVLAVGKDAVKTTKIQFE